MVERTSIQKEKINIFGPCAAESRDQVITTAQEVKKRGGKIIRASLWKPRTRPSFEGVGQEALPWISEVTRMDMIAATEVMLPQHVNTIIEGVESNEGNPSNMLVWLGSRNQNQYIQREVAERTKDTPQEVKLLIKNQPWPDEKHWLGAVDHVLSTGIDSDRLLLCHRGFYPNGNHNSQNMRNIPDFEMAMRLKEITGLPMLLDPSHIGGRTENVFKVVKQSSEYDFDGLMVEVHPNPDNAETDARQQLDFDDLDRLLEIQKSIRIK